MPSVCKGHDISLCLLDQNTVVAAFTLKEIYHRYAAYNYVVCNIMICQPVIGPANIEVDIMHTHTPDLRAPGRHIFISRRVCRDGILGTATSTEGLWGW